VVRINSDFEAVIAACAEETPDRGSTWINREIRQLYAALFQRGHCHTVEVWSDTRLVGGLYGVSLKGAFFGESMFSRTRDASKIALVHLCARLLAGGYVLLDTQFSTPHLEQFGTEEIPRRVFQAKLQRALAVDAEFLTLDCAATGADAIDIIRSAQRRSAG
ncbi:MAG: leucyl/phenylalanyl-tRNA--protein transferase, partial [Pseudomonadota bacterium]